MTKSLDLKRDDPRSHPFDTTAPSISRRALDQADLLSGDYWGELRTFLWVAKAGSWPPNCWGRATRRSAAKSAGFRIRWVLSSWFSPRTERSSRRRGTR